MESLEKKITLESIESEEIKNVRIFLKKFYILWDEFGIDEEQTIQRGKAVWKHLWTLLDDIYREEISFYEDIKERVQNYTKKINDLAKILSVTPLEEKSASLIKKEENLRQELDSLTKLKHKRIKSYQELRSIESKYCSLLGMEEHHLPSFTGVPSESELKEIDQHIKMLKDERDRRYKKFCSVKKELTTILEITELTPETALERDVLSGSDSIPLTNETLKALEDVVSKAQKKKIELETRKEELLVRLKALWNRLKIADSEKTEFLSKHVDCKLSTVNSIQKELERCEKIKKENIKMYIENLRQELKHLWDKCYVSDKNRNQFTLLQSDEMTDEVLEAHEAEVEKWKSYSEVVKHIINKIEKRKELWDLLLVFENKASDPNRFKNRRGNLLKEEKDRKKLQKDLPALENDIFNEIELYEAVYSKPFLYFDGDYRSFVTNQWQERINQKENEKQERHKLRLLQTENEAVLGTATPAKRPLLTTPRSAPSKLFKTNAGMSVYRTPTSDRSKAIPCTTGKSVLSANKLVKSVRKSGFGHKLFPHLSTRPNAMKKRDQSMVLRERNNKSKVVPDSTNATTYSQFAKELDSSSRRSCRSSVLSTKKVGGTRISQNTSKSKRKSASKTVRRSLRNTSKTTTNLTPARGKLGLPFLI
ncbi:protein regulator of cytokinesis 1 [Parasteatoda tepidariorum]|uniref:protein regulator of cytokinesis 1 n=1 Tax=Parasteatoda tepidariorum TaxID=114398 RepID=UPI00077FADE5|nr:protein regulator of cytokinesis 1 [Parasteatoda tepidariorum]